YIDESDFYRRSHQLIFKAMVELSEDNKAIDVITITDTLESSGHLEDIGGASYLSEISSVTPTAANVSYYAKIVEERSLLRKLITTANDIAQSGYEDNGDVLDVLNNAEQKILEVSEKRNRSGFLNIRDVLNTTYNNIEELHKQGGQITGLSTGYHHL